MFIYEDTLKCLLNAKRTSVVAFFAEDRNWNLHLEAASVKSLDFSLAEKRVSCMER